MQMENVVLKPWNLTLRPIEKYTDPRCIQIDLAADYVITKNHPDESIHSDRVMPLVSLKKFLSILHRKTKTFKTIDNSHFWVSGYYALYFYAPKKDRGRVKKLVKEAVIESGGCMLFDEWYKQHNKNRTSIVQYNGTGSGIAQTYSNLPERVAFL